MGGKCNIAATAAGGHFRRKSQMAKSCPHDATSTATMADVPWVNASEMQRLCTDQSKTKTNTNSIT